MKFEEIKNANISDINVGKKIKEVSKFNFNLSRGILIFYTIIYAIGLFAALVSAENGGMAFCILLLGLILGLLFYLIYVAIYFRYIKNIGLGIMVQDLEEIKKSLNPNKQTFECTNCGCKVDEDDTKCPKCGAIFE